MKKLLRVDGGGLLESMIKTGLVSTGAKPPSSHSSQENREMVRREKKFGLDKPTELKEIMIESCAKKSTPERCGS